MAAITNTTEKFIFLVNEKFKIKHGDTQHLTATAGRKYDKIMKNNRMVFAFIDRATGDIYKPASLSAPAKGVRYTNDDFAKAIKEADPHGSFLYKR